MPRLSVVICTFNRGESLDRCLLSLTKQSYKNFEVVIVDGGSTDKTTTVISKFHDKLAINLVVNTEKELAKVRDQGWRVAKGKYVSWIDDDVTVSPNWATSVTEILDKHPKIGGVTGPTIIPDKLISNRDVFSFYNAKGIKKIFGQFWNYYFLEGNQFSPGKLLKSGAWSPGSNFMDCLKRKGLIDVDYLEACNMTLRRDLINKVNGFDYGFTRVAEWSELDLAIRVKKLGYRLVFSSKVKVEHHISQGGVYSRRTHARQRMENFLKFYFRHIFKLRFDYLIRFIPYLVFLNTYWLYKAIISKNISWLGGWIGTICGLRYVKTKD